MPLYEHVFLARQDMSSQQVESLVDQLKSVVADNGGEVGKVEYWGLKSIAFRLRKNRKAHYTLMNVTAPPEAVFEMERQMRINEDVLRYLTLRVDEHETEPSVMMQKRDRDDRRGGRDRDRGDRDRGDRGDRDRGDRPPRRESSSEGENS